MKKQPRSLFIDHRAVTILRQGSSFFSVFHLVLPVERNNVLLPYPLILGGVGNGLDLHDLLAEHTLAVVGSMLSVDLQAESRKVSHHEVEDLVEDISVKVADLVLFDDELGIDHYGEHLTQCERDGWIHFLELIRKGFFEELAEQLHLKGILTHAS